MTTTNTAAWPALPYAEWADTAATIHRWLQIVGKVRMVRTPPVNHSWHVTLYVSARGLTTGEIPDARQPFREQVEPSLERSREPVVLGVEEQCGDVELPVAHEGAGLDREPRLAIGSEHVAEVQVAVQQQLLAR